jgi:hypothetical protein
LAPSYAHQRSDETCSFADANMRLPLQKLLSSSTRKQKNVTSMMVSSTDMNIEETAYEITKTT